MVPQEPGDLLIAERVDLECSQADHDGGAPPGAGPAVVVADDPVVALEVRGQRLPEHRVQRPVRGEQHRRPGSALLPVEIGSVAGLGARHETIVRARITGTAKRESAHRATETKERP